MIRSHIRRVVLVLLVGSALSACSQSSLRISPDFGNALSQDVAAQIADPDAHYKGTPGPGSNGARVGLAQQRYETNTVVQPASTSTSSAAAGGSGGSGGSGGGSGASAGASN